MTKKAAKQPKLVDGKHPRRKQILAYVKTMKSPRHDRRPLLKKVAGVLDYYAKSKGELYPSSDEVTERLYRWIYGTLGQMEKGTVSESMCGLFKMMGYTWQEPKKGKPKATTTAPVRVEIVPKDNSMRIRQPYLKQRLLMLRPEGRFQDEVDDALAESIWWHWFTQWLDHDRHHPRRRKSDELMKFIAMQPELMRDGGLGKLHREMLNVMKDELEKK